MGGPEPAGWNGDAVMPGCWKSACTVGVASREARTGNSEMGASIAARMDDSKWVPQEQREWMIRSGCVKKGENKRSKRWVPRWWRG
jgi:hypothetical protein